MGGSRLIFGVDAEKGYKPCPIPPRETLSSHLQNGSIQHESRACVPADPLPFVEIPLTTQKSFDRDHTPQSEPLSGQLDSIQALFYDMRHIGQRLPWEDRNHAKVFYEQALFMKDFSDTYPGSAPFKRYHPCYQDMSYEQLRTYFTWRTQVRSGFITKTSTSYAFLYLFELLNNSAQDDPAQGLEQLLVFWESFRVIDPILDRYVLPWLKDYHVYYPNLGSFQEFAQHHNLQNEYPSVFCFSSDHTNSFEIFSQLSSYDIKSSRYYSESTAESIHACFFFILDHLRSLFKQKGMRFEDAVFCSSERKTRWIPFSKALFYSSYEQPDRTVEISEVEQYTCEGNIWSGNTVLLTDSGKQLIGYIMKAMEVQLRTIDRFRYKLSAHLDSYKSIDRDTLCLLDTPLPHIIEQCCMQFHAQRTHTAVSVDVDNLIRIREELQTNQEKLLVPDKEATDSFRINLPETAPSALSDTADIMPPEAAEAEVSPVEKISEHSTCWADFSALLHAIDREALLVVLRGGDVRAFARSQAIMPEVLIDSINEKAMDTIGDAILEFDDTAVIFDEYLKDIKGALEVHE